jgi:hypothetical protein
MPELAEATTRRLAVDKEAAQATAPARPRRRSLRSPSLDSIDTSTLVGLRDRALIGVVTYAFARVGAVVA